VTPIQNLIETDGAGLAAMSGSAVPAGFLVMAHGCDQLVTGMRTAFFGTPQDTATSQPPNFESPYGLWLFLCPPTAPCVAVG